MAFSRTQCNQESFAFAAHFLRRVVAELSADRVTTDGAPLVRQLDRRLRLQPEVLEDHTICFIGVNSVIMPGVTVGKAAVVASGAVVITSVPPYTMVAGNPAKVVKTFRKPPEEA